MNFFLSVINIEKFECLILTLHACMTGNHAFLQHSIMKESLCKIAGKGGLNLLLIST
jgi:hypothetical protein